MVLRKLAISNFRNRKIRFGLTIAAVALSVSLVVSVTSGYSSLEATVLHFMTSFIGKTDVHLSSTAGQKNVPMNIVEMLRADPEVVKITGRLESNSLVLNIHGGPIGTGPSQIIGVEDPPTHIPMKEGAWFDGADGKFAVIDQVAARAIKGMNPAMENAPTVKVGEQFTIPGAPGELRLTIAGIVHKPTLMALQQPTIYVPLKTLQRFIQKEALSRADIELKEGASSGAFVERWGPKLKAINAQLRLKTNDERRKDFDRQVQGMRLMSYLGGMVSMLAATFIVLSTLSMGVSERQRTLAMLRAIGAQRAQLAKLVILEGVLLVGIGVIIGVPLGILWVWLLKWYFSDLFAAGLIINIGGIAFAAGACLAASLLASFLPAWAAMRVTPLEAMSPLAETPTARAPLLAAVAGGILASLDSILLFTPWEQVFSFLGFDKPDALAQIVGFYGHFILGLPGIMIGFFLLAPLFVWVIERFAGPIVAKGMGVRFAILRQQLSGSIWRAAGTGAALMVGLAILVVMQTQGHSMLGGWKLPTNFPDIFLLAWMSPLDKPQQEKLRQVPEIKELLPMAIAFPELPEGFLNALGALVLPDATMFFGVDPDVAPKMIELDFRDGKPEEAWAKLKQGKHVIITEEYRRLKGLETGDKITVISGKGERTYTIAGVVWSPGIDVMVSMFDMGQQFEQRTAFTLIGSLEDAANDFGETRIRFFAANLQPGVNKRQLVNQINHKVFSLGIQAGDVRHIKAKIEGTFRNLLLLASTVAFAAMGVASLGVTNTIMASIRSRRWQFGILRSVGVTRGALLRLILSEALLLGMVGAALGLSAGLLMSVNAKQLAIVIMGYDPELQIPWMIIWIGVGIVMTVTLLASLLPARHVARTEVLELLQAGRAAT